jgi:hypothetical protein
MHIKTLTTMSILLIGIAACNNPKPADPAVSAPAADTTTPASDKTMPTNTVDTMTVPSNVITETAPPPPPPGDQPRGLPDRRSDAPSEGVTEAK